MQKLVGFQIKSVFLEKNGDFGAVFLAVKTGLKTEIFKKTGFFNNWPSQILILCASVKRKDFKKGGGGQFQKPVIFGHTYSRATCLLGCAEGPNRDLGSTRNQKY